MKKVLSMLLCISLLVCTFATAPLTVSAISDIRYDFATIADGQPATNWALGNATITTTPTVTTSKTISLTNKSGSTDPYFITPGFTLSAVKYDTVLVGLKWTGITGGVTPLVYFNTDYMSSGWLAGDYYQTTTANTSADSGGVVEFSFNVSAKPGWKGNITKLRIDPAEKAGTYELSYVTLVGNGKAAATFNRNGGYGVSLNIGAVAGTQITLPVNTYKKLGWTFAGWNDGSTTYQPGDLYTLATDKTFNAVWTETSSAAIMGKAWEFNTGTSTEGWAIKQKVTNFNVLNGYLNATASGVTGTTYDSRIVSPLGMALDPSYCILKFKAKNINPATENFSFGGGSAYFTRTLDGVDVTSNGVRNLGYTIPSGNNNGFVEYTIDLSTQSNWTSEVYGLWMDPVRGPDGTTVQIDYIRLYRKGANTITYDKNTTDTVTFLPASDTKAAKGTGYMLSGLKPVRTGYTFLGWSTTTNGTVLANNAVDVTAATTTVYAQWRTTQNATASFEGGSADVTGSVDSITVVENNDIVLPQNGFTKTGYTFIGWTDGTNRYSAGATYPLGITNVTFKPVWNMPVPTFSPANGATQVDYRNLAIQVPFPVDMDASTLTTDNFSTAWAQSVAYNATTKTATIYLKPDLLKQSTTVSFTTSSLITSADHLLVLPATAYSFSTITTPQADGENLISNGNFELPFIPAYDAAKLELIANDTPSGTGTSLKTTVSGAYGRAKFNMYVKPSTVYYMEFDGKLLNDTAGNSVTTNLYTAFKLTAGNDTAFGGLLNITSNGAWKHFSGYTNANASYTSMATGSQYFFIFSDKPTTNNGVNFMIDNVVVKEAYPVTYAGGTVSGKSVTGAVDMTYRPKGGKVTLPTSGFSCYGMQFSKWTDGTNQYAAGSDYTVPLNGAQLTPVWEQSAQYSASFASGTGATGDVPSTITGKYAGDTITLPANTLTKDACSFAGWYDGTTTYAENATYTMPAANVVFTAKWRKNAIVGLSSEFNTPDSFDGWDGLYGFAVKEIKNGTLNLETTMKDARLQKTLTNYNNTDGKAPMSSEYNLLKIRYKKPVNAATGILRWQRVTDDPGTNDVVTAETTGRRYNIYFANSGVASDEWIEQTFDLSQVANWNGDIRALWLDVAEYTTASTTDHGKIQYDYIRFARKGNYSVTYDANQAAATQSAGSCVISNMPANDSTLLISDGTGYMLSGTTPTVNVNTLIFAGWSLTPDAVGVNNIITTNTVDITGNTTLYAVWNAVPTSVTATFANGDENATGTVDAITEDYVLNDGGATITLPTNTFVLSGKDFAGWYDGTSSYPAGTVLLIQKDKIYTAVWQNHKYAATFNIGEGATYSSTVPTSYAEVGTNPTLIDVNTYGIAKAGYYFGGWKLDNAIYASGTKLNMPAHDIAFTAFWIANSSTTPLAPGSDVYGGPYQFENGIINFIPGGVGEIVADPTNASNSVFKFTKYSDYANMAANVTLEGGRRYFISTKVFVDPTATASGNIQTNFRYGEVDHAKPIGTAVPGVWTTLTTYFDVPASNAVSGSLTLYTNPFAGVTDGKGYILYDDISIKAGYKITYNVDGTTYDTAWTANTTYVPTVTTQPVKGGFNFLGWSTDGTTVVSSITLTNEDKVLYAVWGTVLPQIHVTFVAGNGTVQGTAPSPIIREYDPENGVNISLPENTFTKEGYSFIGWTDGTHVFAAGSSYLGKTDSVEFTAIWDQNIFGKIGAQILKNTTADSATTTLRFLTGINRTDCTEVGFIISSKSDIDTLEEAQGSSNAIVMRSTKIYNKVVAEDSEILPTSFNGTYILSIKITDIPKSYFGATFYATLYAKKADGTIVYSDAATPYSVNSILQQIGG